MLGEGILKGLAETARNFAGSYVSKERLTTVEYPEERLPLPEASRNFPFLVSLGFVTPTEARRITFEEAVRFEKIHEDTYRDFGFELVSIEPGSLAERVRAIKAAIR